MSAQLRDQQGDLYRSIWASDSNYGTAPEWVADTIDHRIAPFMRRHGFSGETTIDFGAGNGRYLVQMQKRGLCRMGIGIDYYTPASVPAWALWFAQDMSAPLQFKGKADFAISCDALEHLSPLAVYATLRNMHAAATHGWARVSLIEDTYGTARGLQLHETLVSAREWLLMFGAHGMRPLEYRVYLDEHGTERALELGW